MVLRRYRVGEVLTSYKLLSSMSRGEEVRGLQLSGGVNSTSLLQGEAPPPPPPSHTAVQVAAFTLHHILCCCLPVVFWALLLEGQDLCFTYLAHRELESSLVSGVLASQDVHVRR